MNITKNSDDLAVETVFVNDLNVGMDELHLFHSVVAPTGRRLYTFICQPQSSH